MNLKNKLKNIRRGTFGLTILVALFVLIPVIRAVASIQEFPVFFKSEESDTLDNNDILKQQERVNTSILNGRIWLPTPEEAGVVSPEPGVKFFIGWKRNGINYSAEEHYSLTDEDMLIYPNHIEFTAVWGYQVFVSGDGCDDFDGLTYNTRVRTMGRAYEILARLDTGNPNANINGISVTYNPEGQTLKEQYVMADDTTNYEQNYNGIIVVCGELDFHDEKEGRYEYITIEDILAKTSNGTITSGQTITFNDGVRDIEIKIDNANHGYAPNERVRFQATNVNSADPSKNTKKYTMVTKGTQTASYYMLKKELNLYQYLHNGNTYTTYGRLVQFSAALRSTTMAGLDTAHNNGLIKVTSLDEANNHSYQGTTNSDRIYLKFADFSRYALGGDTIFKDINLYFFKPSRTVNNESTGYIGGLMGNGNYLVIDKNVYQPSNTIQPTAAGSFLPNLYGGGYSYRFNSRYYSGIFGNQLGDSGPKSANNSLETVAKNLTSARLTVKSGRWGGIYGSYGQEIGNRDLGEAENNASVVNLYGGYVNAIGASGHEGALAKYTFLYIYGMDNNIDTANGAGAASTGGVDFNGRTNILIDIKDSNYTINTIYGGSKNGTHNGGANIVVDSGIINTIYGGCEASTVSGNVDITINGGTITTVYGGGVTGGVLGKIKINVNGGTIGKVQSNGQKIGGIYTSGRGNTNVTVYNYFQGSSSATGLETQITDKTDMRLNTLIPVNLPQDNGAGGFITEYNEALQALITDKALHNLRARGFTENFHNNYTYLDNNGNLNYYPHVFAQAHSHKVSNITTNYSDYEVLITGYAHGSYTNYVQTGQSTIIRYLASLSLASAGSTELNLNGGIINANVFGGGPISQVLGDTLVNISGDVIINGDVYGGGDGSDNPVVTISTEIDNFNVAPHTNTTKTQNFKWAGEETFDMSQYDLTNNVPIDYNRGLVYSPNFVNMGTVHGNTFVNVSGGTIKGNVYGGGKQGSVYGNTNVEINGGNINGSIYAGSEQANIGNPLDSNSGNVSLIVNNGNVNTVYGGNNVSGTINGISQVQVNGGIINSVYGGGNNANIDETNIFVTGGFVNYIYGGGNNAATDITNITISNGTIKGNVYGGGRNGNVNSVSNVTMTGGEIIADNTIIDISTGNLFGGGFLGDVKDSVVDLSGGIIENHTNGGGYRGHVLNLASVKLSGDVITGSVYGGGFNGNAKDTIIDLNDSARVNGSVYGGGENGNVTNNTKVILNGGVVTGSIFGGGENGNVTNSTNVLVNANVEGDVYGGGYRGSASSTYVKTVNGYIHGSIFGGGYEGVVTELAKVEISGTAEVDYVYGGGYGAAAKTGNTEIRFNSNNAIVNGDIYGGGNEGDVLGTTSIYFDGGRAKTDIYGGGYASNVKNTYIEINSAPDPSYLNHIFGGSNTSGHVENTKIVLNISSYARLYGGNNAGGIVDNSEIIIAGGVTLQGNVYGGGLGSAAVTKNTNITLNGSVATHAAGDGSIYGGGDLGPVSGEAKIVINGDVANDVYGGGYAGTVKDTSIKIINGTINGNVYGGGNEGNVTNSTYVEIDGQNVVLKQSLYGGGNQADALNSHVVIKNGHIKGNVYGGGRVGHITENANVEMSGGFIDAFNDISDPEYATKVLLSGHIYGGGFQGNVKNTIVNVTGGTISKNIHGGGFQGNVTNKVIVRVSGSNTTSPNVESIFGGGYNGHINDAEVYINGNVNVTAPIYGGGKFGDANKTNVNVDASLNVDIYGGGYQGRTEETVVIANGTNNGIIIGNIYGGGEEGYVDKAYVVINGATVNRSIFGGGKNADTGITSVQLWSGIITGNVYGGGRNGDVVTSNISMTLNTLGLPNMPWYDQSPINPINQALIKKYIVGTNPESDLVFAGLETGNIYGGGYFGNVNQAIINFVAGKIEGNIYGGGYNGHIIGGNKDLDEPTDANIYGTIIKSLGSYHGEIAGSIYGGGYAGRVDTNTKVDVKGNVKVNSVYGGGYAGDILGNTFVIVSGDVVIDSVFGGGYEGVVEQDTNVVVKGSSTVNLVFGGGYSATANNTNVTTDENATILSSVFGGGYNGNVNNTTNVHIDGGVIATNVYGAGFAGGANITNVNLNKDPNINYQNDIFGGSHTDGTVIETNVNINAQISGNVYGGNNIGGTSQTTNVAINATGVVLGNVYGAGFGNQTVAWNTNIDVYGTVGSENLGGFVYGGGNLGHVGIGTISIEGTSATITKAGSTSIVLHPGGVIKSDLFGGGSGVPVTGQISNVSDGVVFGKTKVEIKGGLVNNDIFGGGNRARVYASTDSLATEVIINAINDQVVIKGAVFGGGNSIGDGISNASIITIVGNTSVQVLDNPTTDNISIGSIINNKEVGGIYGGGNLCLVSGTRNIYIENFGTEGERQLKTIQRADNVELVNCNIGLRGALDRVSADGDSNLYSINRVLNLEMKEESSITFYAIVNELGSLTSDNAYNDSDNNFGSFNNIIISNGKWLDIGTTTSSGFTYGSITGTFNLYIIDVTPGDGGAYVFADLDSMDTAVMRNPDLMKGIESGQFTYWFVQGEKYITDLNQYGYAGSTIGDKVTTSLLAAGNYSLYLKSLSISNTEFANMLVDYDNLVTNSNNISIVVKNNKDNNTFNITNTTSLDQIFIGDRANGFPTISFELFMGTEVTSIAPVVIELIFEDTNNPASQYIIRLTVEIRGQDINKVSYGHYGRYYSGINNPQDINVTNNSCFTIQFITTYAPGVYGSIQQFLKIETGNYPIGTKITFVDLTLPTTPKFYYYIVKTAKNEINLSDFIPMGKTEETTLPEERYYCSTSNLSIIENLLFIIDFEDVANKNEVTDNSISLIHSHYNGTIFENDPPIVDYHIDVASIDFDVVRDQEMESDQDTYVFNVNIFEGTIKNTDYTLGEYGVIISMKNGLKFPNGTVFEYNGQRYIPEPDNKSVIIPVKKTGEHLIYIKNSLGGFNIVDPIFSFDLYSSSDSFFPKEHFITNTEIDCTNVEAEIEIMATTNKTINSKANSIDVNVSYYSSVAGKNITASLYKKVGTTYQLVSIPVAILTTIVTSESGKNEIVSILLSSLGVILEAGVTYRLELIIDAGGGVKAQSVCNFIAV